MTVVILEKGVEAEVAEVAAEVADVVGVLVILGVEVETMMGIETKMGVTRVAGIEMATRKTILMKSPKNHGKFISLWKE